VPVCEACRPFDPLSITKLLGQAPAQAGSTAEPGTKGSVQAPGVLRESQGQLQDGTRPTDGGQEAHGLAPTEIHHRKPNCPMPAARCPHTVVPVWGGPRLGRSCSGLLGKARWVCEPSCHQPFLPASWSRELVDIG